MSEPAAFSATVYGRVQGVNFRYFAHRHASSLGLTGYVRNSANLGALEVHAEGERAKLEELLGQIEVGPPRADVKRVEVTWLAHTGLYSRFRVRY
jgi:acylphosphatase